MKDKKKGQVLVEFVLLLPLLALIFVAILHYGIIFWANIGITAAVREGAIYASYHPTNDDRIKQAVTAALPSWMVAADEVITVNVQSASRTVGTSLTIKMTYDIIAAGALPGGAIMPTPNKIGASATAIILSTP